MPNTVTANLETKLTVSETIDLTLNNVTANPQISHVITGAAVTLDADSTPAATKVSSGTKTLSSGNATIDLTAAPGPTVNGTAANLDMTGLKVNAVKFVANANNTDDITIEGHATNGYDLWGSEADGVIALGPGDAVVLLSRNSNPDVGASAKIIDLNSADLDAVLDFIIVAG